MDFSKITKQYIDDVMARRIPVSEVTRKTVVRHLNDIEQAPDKGWYFDEKAALKVIKFFSHLSHTKGRKHAGLPFILEPWQCFIIWCVFGWKKANGTRRFSKAYVQIAKKNGKTAFAGGIADYCLIMDDEPEAEVYCAATKRDQAKICFNQAKAYIEKNPMLLSYSGAQFVTNNISIPKSGSKMQPIGRDSYGLDGINPSTSIIDEYHEWQKDDVKDSIETASVSRMQTLMFIITTAGYNKTWPCYEFYRFCLDILDGVKVQDDVFAMIFAPDEGDDWHDIVTWKKANPNYGKSVEEDKMQEAFNQAVNRGGRSEVSFKTKNLNMWVDAPTTWISDDIIFACNYGTMLAELQGKECYAGLDLAGWVDINSLALYFPNVNGRKVALFFFWIPEAKVEERGDRVDYRLWRDKGLIIVTAGNTVDIDQQVSDIVNIFGQYNIKSLSYDPAKAYSGTIQGLQKAGLDDQLQEFPQGIRFMSEPTKELERAVTNKEFDFLGNPVIRWMFRNVFIIRDTNDNIKVDKKKSIDKVDGVVALVNAIAGSMSGPANEKQIYQSHSLRVL